MRVLLIKTSSMGDVLHTLVPIQELAIQRPDIQIDWVVEESFQELPRWNPKVSKVIPIALRRWRKSPFSAKTRQEVRQFIHTLRETSYDCVLDAQGLLKSALVARLARGKRVGLNFKSAREPLSSLFYEQSFEVPTGEHAIVRLRRLFSAAFGYALLPNFFDCGIAKERLKAVDVPQNYVVFLHSTTWDTKHWPEAYWAQLIRLAKAQGFSILLPWGNESERLRAERLSKEGAVVLPKLKLAEVAFVLQQAKGCVAVDTGLGHVSAAVATPTVSLYGSTSPGLTGALGQSQSHLHATLACSPCFKRHCRIQPDAIFPPCLESLKPERVWQQLQQLWLTDEPT